MKKFLISLAVLLAVSPAFAQTKTPEAAKKAVESAELATQNPKKNTKVGTWTKLADAYVQAYSAPAGSAWVGASKQELMLLMGSEQPLSTDVVELGGETYIKETYPTREYYYTVAQNEAGQLVPANIVLINVTQPVFEDALAGAVEAYAKAYEVDVKKSKSKDIAAGLEKIARMYLDDGMKHYMFGDLVNASLCFEKAAEASAQEPLAKLDTTAVYNAGYTAVAVKDYERARKFFEQCLAAGYYYDDGEVFARLADVYTNLGDAKNGAEVLEEGFVKFPQSQSILIGLINYYMTSGENADRLFVLIDEAKKNEPDNASLYYVEGNIYKELKQNDKAIDAYMACSKINPEYEFGYIGAGILYYEEAVELSEKASEEYDDNKYMALVEQFEQALLNALEPFEKAYEVTKDDALKVNIAEYLKNIYYRFISKGAEYEDGYNRYNEIVRNGRA